MTQTAAHAAADALIARIADGTVVFQRDTREAGSPWRIIGRADIAVPGYHVDVTKADGTTKRVQVYAISRSGERNGVSYTIALFRNSTTEPAWREQAAADAAGRRHGVNGQIWD